MSARSSSSKALRIGGQALHVPVDAPAPNDLQRRARGQRDGRYGRGWPSTPFAR